MLSLKQCLSTCWEGRTNPGKLRCMQLGTFHPMKALDMGYKKNKLMTLNAHMCSDSCLNEKSHSTIFLIFL